MLPNFLVIGAEKSATTWIYNRLMEHPEVFMPPTKEIHFFNKYNSNLEDIDCFERLGLDWYKKFFESWNGQIAVGEVTPMYLCDPFAPKRISDTLPNVKLIVCIRDPVDRAYSHYRMAKTKGHVDTSFDQVVQSKEYRFIERGLYYNQLKKYYELFPKSQIYVLLFDDILIDPFNAIKGIYGFIEVDSYFYPPGLRLKDNGTQKYRSTLLLKFTNKLTRLLRRQWKLGMIVDIAKMLRISNLVKHINKMPSSNIDNYILSMSIKIELYNYYQQDLELLAQIIDRDLTQWKIN